MTILTLIFTNLHQESSVCSGLFLFCKLGLLACVFAIHYVLLQALDGLKQQAMLQEKLNFETHTLEVKLAEQNKHSPLMSEHAEQLRQQRLPCVTSSQPSEA